MVWSSRLYALRISFLEESQIITSRVSRKEEEEEEEPKRSNATETVQSQSVDKKVKDDLPTPPTP